MNKPFSSSFFAILLIIALYVTVTVSDPPSTTSNGFFKILGNISHFHSFLKHPPTNGSHLATVIATTDSTPSGGSFFFNWFSGFFKSFNVTLDAVNTSSDDAVSIAVNDNTTSMSDSVSIASDNATTFLDDFFGPSDPISNLLFEDAEIESNSSSRLKFPFVNLTGVVVFSFNLSELAKEEMHSNPSASFTLFSNSPINWEIRNFDRVTLQSNMSVTETKFFLMKEWIDFFIGSEDISDLSQSREFQLVVRAEQVNESASGWIALELADPMETTHHPTDLSEQIFKIEQYFLEVAHHDLFMSTAFETAYHDATFWIEATATLQKPEQVTAFFSKCNATTGPIQMKANHTFVVDRRSVGDINRMMHIVCAEDLMENWCSFAVFDDERVVGDVKLALRPSPHETFAILFSFIAVVAALVTIISLYIIIRRKARRRKNKNKAEKAFLARYSKASDYVEIISPCS